MKNHSMQQPGDIVKSQEDKEVENMSKKGRPLLKDEKYPSRGGQGDSDDSSSARTADSLLKMHPLTLFAPTSSLSCRKRGRCQFRSGMLQFEGGKETLLPQNKQPCSSLLKGP